jgi:hypothetical protein
MKGLGRKSGRIVLCCRLGSCGCILWNGDNNRNHVNASEDRFVFFWFFVCLRDISSPQSQRNPQGTCKTSWRGKRITSLLSVPTFSYIHKSFSHSRVLWTEVTQPCVLFVVVVWWGCLWLLISRSWYHHASDVCFW